MSLFISISLILLNCSSDVTEGSGSEVTNGFTFTALLNDTLVADNSVVKVRPYDFFKSPLSEIDSTDSTRDFITGSLGEVKINNLADGEYFITIMRDSSYGTSFSLSLFGGEIIQIPSKKLSKNSTLSGSIDTMNLPEEIKVFIQIQGTDFVTELNEDGSYFFKNLPEFSSLDIRIISENSISEPFIIEAVSLSADTSIDVGSNKIISSNIVGFWNLDESGSGVLNEFKDFSFNRLSGTGGAGIDSLTPIITTGIIDSAQLFDGVDDFIQIPNDSTIQFQESFTVSFWTKYDSSSNYNQRFISKDEDWDIKEDHGRPQISIGGAYMLSSKVIEHNVWTMITITLENLNSTPEAYIYVNGELTSAFENNFTTNYNNSKRSHLGELYFGTFQGSGYYLDGALDQVIISNDAYTSDDIYELYSSANNSYRN